MSESPSDPLEAMSSAVEAFNRRDFDAIESLYAEDAVLAGVDLGSFEGASAIRSLYEEMTTPYRDFTSQLDAVNDLGNGIGFAVVTVAGHPVGSTGEVRLHYGSVVVLADGVIVQQTNYMDIDEARAAAERLAAERE